MPWWNEHVPLFNVMLHCLTETTRHAGHADILRETIDGAVGVERGAPPMHGRDADFWDQRWRTIDNIASQSP